MKATLISRWVDGELMHRTEGPVGEFTMGEMVHLTRILCQEGILPSFEEGEERSYPNSEAEILQMCRAQTALGEDMDAYVREIIQTVREYGQCRTHPTTPA